MSLIIGVLAEQLHYVRRHWNMAIKYWFWRGGRPPTTPSLSTNLFVIFSRTITKNHKNWIIRYWRLGKGKAVPLQAWKGPEGSRKIRFPDFMTTAQNGGRLSVLRTASLYPPGNTPGTHFCQWLSRPQGHSAIGRMLCQWKIHWHQLGSNQRPTDL